MDSNQPRGNRYEIVLRGELSDHFGCLFDGMRMQRRAGTTVLTGEVADQARLMGLIERTQELGLELVSVGPDAGTSQAPAFPAGDAAAEG